MHSAWWWLERSFSPVERSDRRQPHKATEEVHRATEQEFQHWHKLLSQREAAMHMQIATLSDQKKDSMLHGPRATTKMSSP